MAPPVTPLPGFVENVPVTPGQLNNLSTLINGLLNRTMGGYLTRRPAVAARCTDPLTVPSGTGALTVLTWDAEDRDDGGMLDPGDSALIAPVDGWYRFGFHATVAVSSAATGATMTGYVIPGTLAPADARAAHTTRIFAPRSHVAASGPIACVAGAPVRFAVRHTAGVSGTTSTLYGGCRAWGYWVAPLGDTDTSDPVIAPPAAAGGLGVGPLGTAPLGG